MSTPLLVVVGQNSQLCPMVGSVLTSPVSSQHSEALLTAKNRRWWFFQPCKIGLLGQNRGVVFSAGHSDTQLCRKKTCTNCSTPHGVAPLLFPFNRFLASPPTNSHANEDDDDGNPKCMGSFDVTGLARRQKMVGRSQHKWNASPVLGWNCPGQLSLLLFTTSTIYRPRPTTMG